MVPILPRILFTSLRKLIALNAQSGKLDTEFGNKGHIDLDIAYAGVPAIFRNVILMGSNFYGPGMQHIGPQLSTSKGERGDATHMTRAAERSSGIFIRFHGRAKLAMTPGATTAGKIELETTGALIVRNIAFFCSGDLEIHCAGIIKTAVVDLEKYKLACLR